MSEDIKKKEEELYTLLLNKLYEFFVIEKKEARVDTVVNLLSILKPFKVDTVDEMKEFKNFQEVDVI